MKKLLIFGTAPASALLARSIAQDTGRKVHAFAIDRDWYREGTFEDRPVLIFEDLGKSLWPDEFEILFPLGYRRINGLRAEKVLQAQALGYQIGSWVSSRAMTPTDFQPQRNVLVYEGAIIQHFVEIGDNTVIRAGANIGHHSKVESHCFIASRVVTGGHVRIGERCWVGLGAVIRERVTLAPRSFIGAGAVVLQDTEPDGVYVGVPARRLPNKTSMELTA